MLGENATFTAPQKATLKAGNESADLKLDGFTRSCAQKHLSVFVEVTSNQGDQSQTKGGFLAGEGGRILLLLLFIGVSVGVVAFVGSRKKKKASEATVEQNQDENSD